MRVITDFEELDRQLRDCAVAAQVSDDAFRQSFSTFRLDLPRGDEGAPFTPEYAARQMALYEAIAGRGYGVGNEETVFDIASCEVRPFPYTASPAVAGAHLGAIGFLLRHLGLKPGARVLDAGPGWGNTSLAMAQLGFEVTALDVEARFCALIEARARRNGVSIRTVNADFFWIEREARDFDAIVFFECFHHCDDHLRLLRALPGALAPGGKVFFGAEPINESFPLPWGVRTDGESLWAIRRNGWLELGFRESYFHEALRYGGLSGVVHRSMDLPGITVWETAVRPAGPLRFGADSPRLASPAGRRADGLILLEGRPGYALHGPYTPLAAGRYAASITFDPRHVASGMAHMDVAGQQGRSILASAVLDLGTLQDGELKLDFVLETGEPSVEVRLRPEDGAPLFGAIGAVCLAPRGEAGPA